MKRRPPLVTWLFASTVLTLVIGVLAVTLLVDRLVHQQARRDALRLLQANADGLRDALDRGMAQHFAEVRLLSGLQQVAQAPTVADARVALDGFVTSFPQFAWLGLTDASGKVIASANGLLEGVNVSARPWFKGALAGPFVGDVHEAVLLAKLLPAQNEPWRFVDFAFPLKDEQGRIKGVLGAHLSWGWAGQLRQDLSERLAKEAGAEVLVLGSNDIVLLGPTEQQGKKLPPSTDGSLLWATSKSAGHGDFRTLGWQVVVRQPANQALAPYDALHAQTLATAGAVFALLLPMTWWLARRLSRPLVDVKKALSGQAAMPRDDDILYEEARALKQALIEHDERHARQSAALEAMAMSLEKRVDERTRELADINDRLSQSMRDVGRSQERLASILRQSPDAFVCVDAKGLISDWNPAAEALFGWTRDEVRGRLMADILIPAVHRQAHHAGMAAFSKTGEGAIIGKRLELPTLHRDGSVISAELSIGALKAEDGYAAFAFVRDIRERLAAQEEVRISQHRLQQVLGTIPALVGYFDRDARCRYSNELGRKLRGLAPGAEIGLHLREAIGEQNYALHEPHLPKVLTGQRAHFEGSVRQRGQDVHFQVHMVPEKGPSGEVTGFYLMTFDVTALKEAQLQQERARRQLRAITDNLPVMISYIDAEHRLQFLNRTFEQWTGVAVADALGKPMREVIGEQLYEQRREPLAKALEGQRVEFEVVSEALGVRRVLQTAYIPDRPTAEAVVGVYTLTTDVTAMRDAERRMAELALTDTLTGLANRRNFEQWLPLALARAQRAKTATAVMFLDIDHFKRINDTFGHAAGDAVLVTFSQRLAASMRKTDLVARLAGDEFVVVLEGLSDPDVCHLLARKVNEAARQPLRYQDHDLAMTTSIGIAYLPAGVHQTAEAILQDADAALYQTKERGRDGYTTVETGADEAEFSTSSFATL
ncbi:diguanylate cyclase domain-containing protein [Roseateles asaccharophilus]|uniref:sensor domain-containing diguanylate cyclase n=1 Tax=Roseateles asaccharophilus TaxID=582607 RepID=UPI00286C1A69|nr:diguanylate cyclase [Roseateles asaccharophilus]